MNFQSVLGDDTFSANNDQDVLQGDAFVRNTKDAVLCHHCKRTLNNGIRCLGRCVADGDY